MYTKRTKKKKIIKGRFAKFILDFDIHKFKEKCE